MAVWDVWMLVETEQFTLLCNLGTSPLPAWAGLLCAVRADS